jgi:Flp pilus assembly protein TadD
MNNRFPPKFVITAIAILSVFCSVGLLCAEEEKSAPAAQGLSLSKQEQGMEYRNLGLECQRSGNLSEALSFYQKAITVYPNFGPVYNDLGVVYETLGFPDRAEESYLKSIKINPDYVSAYTNLALLFENQRNLDKAAFYWEKRATLGEPGDLWTKRAANRLKDIRMALSGRPFSDSREEDVLKLMKDVGREKARINKNDESLAQERFKKAKLSFKNGDIARAIREALDAQALDQNNPEIEAFIEKAQLRALTR